MIDKELMKSRFAKSLDTYDENALIQDSMARKLVDLIVDKCEVIEFDKVLEIGTGTALLCKYLKDKIEFSQYIGNDIINESEQYLQKYLEDFDFLSGDIEDLELPDNLDLVVSNATLQWVHDIDALSSNLSESLNDGGYMAFTTFGNKNFSEMKELTGLSLRYLDLNQIEQSFSSEFEIIYIKEDLVTLTFKTPIDVLKHIRATGVNSFKSTLWTKSMLKEFEKNYIDKYSVKEGVTLTYNPVYVLLAKPEPEEL